MMFEQIDHSNDPNEKIYQEKSLKFHSDFDQKFCLNYLKINCMIEF